jgi:thymidylate synthase (FAD)
LDVTYSSDVTVELVKHSASDQDVAFAARVSTQGERSLGYPETDEKKLSGLIGFLMRDRHGSPFEHSVFTFYVKAPIFVLNQSSTFQVLIENFFKLESQVLIHLKREAQSNLP